MAVFPILVVDDISSIVVIEDRVDQTHGSKNAATTLQLKYLSFSPESSRETFGYLQRHRREQPGPVGRWSIVVPTAVFELTDHERILLK